MDLIIAEFVIIHLDYLKDTRVSLIWYLWIYGYLNLWIYVIYGFNELF